MKRTSLLAGLALGACLFGLADAALAQTLGRLFFTPERRAALDRQRQFNIMESQPVIEGATLSVSGVVRRSSGKNTAWVNGIPQDERQQAGGVSVDYDPANPGRAIVTAGDEAPARLKVGEAINRTTRETTSPIGGGSIAVKREGAKGR